MSIEQAARLTQAGLDARTRGDLNQALAYQQQAIAAAPNNWGILLNLGAAYQDCGLLDDAIDCFNTSWQTSAHPIALTNLALANLRQQPTHEGFKQFLARWQVEQWPQQPYQVPCPHLDKAMKGRLLVMPDQGYGDGLMCLPFIRSLLLAQPDAVVLVKTPLLRLFQLALSDVTDQVLSQVTGRFDAWLTGFDIPAFFPNALTDYAQHRDTIRTQLHKKLLEPEKKTAIALVWRGNPQYAHEQWRQIGLTELLQLPILQGAKSLLPLLPDVSAQELYDLKQHHANIITHTPIDFYDTARQLLGAERLITTDTASVHLAGLLGVPTQLLLSRLGDWRWGNDQDACNWYDTVQIYRQQILGDWTNVIQRMIA